MRRSPTRGKERCWWCCAECAALGTSDGGTGRPRCCGGAPTANTPEAAQQPPPLRMRPVARTLPCVLFILFLNAPTTIPHAQAAPIPSLWKTVTGAAPSLKRSRGAHQEPSPLGSRRQANATGLRLGEPGVEPLTSVLPPTEANTQSAHADTTAQQSSSADYHAKCKARGGGCLRWEGLSCEEVDSILHNVQRYSASVSVPRPSSSSSRPGESNKRGLGEEGEERGARGESSSRRAFDAAAAAARESRALAAKRKLVQELQTQGTERGGVERARTAAGNVVLSAPRAPLPLPPRPSSAALPAPWSSARMLHAHRQAQQQPVSASAAAAAAQQQQGSVQAKAASFPGIDVDGHVAYRLGDGLEPSSALPRGRYKILRSLGSGTYGKVVECWDRQLGEYCAVKVVRAVPKYRSSAQTEVKVLSELRGEHGCVRMLRSFDYNGHMCLVFELLGPNLYDVMRATGFQPLSVRDIHLVSRQVLESLCLVHGRRIVHTDVKPENVLFLEQLHKRGVVFRPGHMNAQDLRVKLVDFGSAVYDNSQHAAVVSTRHYRAPEIILKLGWSYPCDMWSVGCILVELYTGEVLFGLCEEISHLAAMERVLDPFPQAMLQKALQRGAAPSLFRHRDEGKEGRWELDVEGAGLPEASLKALARAKPLSSVIRHGLLLDLIRRMLEMDPARRITASEALMHPFFGTT